jgi:hypothetical protein
MTKKSEFLELGLLGLLLGLKGLAAQDAAVPPEFFQAP